MNETSSHLPEINSILYISALRGGLLIICNSVIINENVQNGEDKTGWFEV